MPTSDASPPCNVRLCSADVSQRDEAALWQTRRWLENAVIDLNLCPFARPVHQHSRLWLTLSYANTPVALAADLERELKHLLQCDPGQIESVILIHPFVLYDFDDYIDFIEIADQSLESHALTGEIQIASFHPAYCFDGVPPNDITNNTNRSPYPMLHLLRESSVSRAVDMHGDTSQISRANQQLLTDLGPIGWAELSRQWDKL